MIGNAADFGKTEPSIETGCLPTEGVQPKAYQGPLTCEDLSLLYQLTADPAAASCRSYAQKAHKKPPLVYMAH